MAEGDAPAETGDRGVGDVLIKSAASAKAKRPMSREDLALFALKHSVDAVAQPYTPGNKAPKPGPYLTKQDYQQAGADSDERAPFALHNKYRNPAKREERNWTVVHPPLRNYVGYDRSRPLEKPQPRPEAPKDPCRFSHNPSHMELDSRTGRPAIDILMKSGVPDHGTELPVSARRRPPAAASAGAGPSLLTHSDEPLPPPPASGTARVRRDRPRTAWVEQTQAAVDAPVARQTRKDPRRWTTKTCPRRPLDKEERFRLYTKPDAPARR